MNDKANLLKQIQMCDFVLNETALYLDTHKNDKEALKYFATHKEMVEKYRKEYTSKYGPLTQGDVTSDTTWTWVEGTWPWEVQ